MTTLTEFLNDFPNYLGVSILMLSAFLIGYFAAFWGQRAKYGKLTKKLKDEVNAFKMKRDVNDIDTIFTEIKPKIVKVVKETQGELTDMQSVNDVKSPEEVVENTRTSFITYTKAKPKLNFESIGVGSPNERDDLTLINGIGPYIEQKLNEIGIYNYDQIRKLTFSDIRVVNELIDFFPGRIERDEWVQQAQSLKVH